jgi:hypothetical protein
MPYALFFKMETADVLFLGCAFAAALLLVLLTNPLTSWVTRMLKKKK